MLMKTAIRLSLVASSLTLLIAACSSPGGGTLTGTAGSSGPGNGGTTGAGGSIACGAGQMVCGTSCVNTTSDPNNCGGCFIPCSTGQICQNSQCGCQAGLLDCNGACVPSDASHCGSCTTVCGANQVCSNNACSSDCGAQTLCGTACVDTASSNANCGSCGRACAATQRCENSNCVDVSSDRHRGNGRRRRHGGVGQRRRGRLGQRRLDRRRRGGTTGTAGRGGTTGSAGTGGGTGGTTPAMTLVTSAPSAYWKTDGALTDVRPAPPT